MMQMADGSESILSMLDANRNLYRVRQGYFERSLDHDLISKIYQTEPLNLTLVTAINPKATWEAIVEAASEIGYPVGYRSNCKKGQPTSGLAFSFENNAGSNLISHTVARAVPSAQRSLTSVFGMGTGDPSRYCRRQT